MIIGLSAATAAVAATGAVSSFAWFATNNTVTATGMKVKIQSAATLLIDTANTTASNGRLKNGASTKTVTTTDATVSPVSTVDGATWFSAKAAEADSATAITNSYEQVTEADANKYYLANTVYLQTFDATKKTTDKVSPDSNIVIDSITVTGYDGDNDALNTSFRVLTVIGEKKVFCGPTSTTKPSNKGVASVTDGAATMSEITYANVKDLTNRKATIDSDNILVENVTYNTIYTANIYLYFDGEDEACKTVNIPDADHLNNYEVTVSFSLVNKA